MSKNYSNNPYDYRSMLNQNELAIECPIDKRIIVPPDSYEISDYRYLTKFMRATTDDMDLILRIKKIEFCLLRDYQPIYWLSKSVTDLLMASDVSTSEVSLYRINIPLKSGIIMLPRNTILFNDEPAVFVSFANFNGHTFDIVSVTGDKLPSYQHSYLPLDATPQTIPKQRFRRYSEEVKEGENEVLAMFLFKLFMFLQNRTHLISQVNVKKAKKKSYRKRAEHETWTANIIGKNYQVDIPKEENSKEPEPRGRNRAHSVMGHLKGVWRGKGKGDYGVTWVDPYSRGS